MAHTLTTIQLRNLVVCTLGETVEERKKLWDEEVEKIKASCDGELPVDWKERVIDRCVMDLVLWDGEAKKKFKIQEESVINDEGEWLGDRAK